MSRGGGRSTGSRSSGGGSGSRSFGGGSGRASRGGGGTHMRGSSPFYGRPPAGDPYRRPPGPPMHGPGRVHVHHHYDRGYHPVTNFFAGLAIFIMLIIATSVLFYGLSGTSTAGVTKSTVNREALSPYAAFSTDCVDDDAGWISDRRTLLQGMERFYKETGIQPALAVYEEIDGQKYLPDELIEPFMNKIYDERIGHERGLLLLFCEYAPSDYYVYYMAGEDAQTVMDTEACDILLDYAHGLYAGDYSDEEYFAAVFAKTGERIMTVTPTMASKLPFLAGCVIVIVLVLGGLKALSMKHRREAERAEETERILNAPTDRI